MIIQVHRTKSNNIVFSFAINTIYLCAARPSEHAKTRLLAPPLIAFRSRPVLGSSRDAEMQNRPVCCALCSLRVRNIFIERTRCSITHTVHFDYPLVFPTFSAIGSVGDGTFHSEDTHEHIAETKYRVMSGCMETGALPARPPLQFTARFLFGDQSNQ